MLPFFALFLMLPAARFLGSVTGANDFTLAKIAREALTLLLIVATICGLVYSAVLLLRLKDRLFNSRTRCDRDRSFE